MSIVDISEVETRVTDVDDTHVLVEKIASPVAHKVLLTSTWTIVPVWTVIEVASRNDVTVTVDGVEEVKMDVRAAAIEDGVNVTVVKINVFVET